MTRTHSHRRFLSSLSSLVVLGWPTLGLAQARQSTPVITSDAPAPATQPAREAPENQPERPPVEVVPAAPAAPPSAGISPASAASPAAPSGVEAVPAPTPSAAATAPSLLKIGGGGTLWFYQPTEEGQKNKLEFYNVRLTLDSNFGDGFALHVEPRIRDTPLRSFYGGTAWIEEGYASFSSGTHTFKLGKVYSQLGLFWNNSFWGNVQVYDGLKLDPDYGGSLEGKFQLQPRWGIGYAAQFFVVDGSTNVSLPGRDTLSIPNARRRNIAILRVDPYFDLGADGLARLGLSGERFTADIPGIPNPNVERYGVDFKVTLAGAGLWGEFLHQHGQSVTDHPIASTPATSTDEAVPGRASSSVDYYEIGAEYTYRRLTVRYNFSAANYNGTSVKEWLHEPALGFKVNDYLSLGGEYVSWSRSVAGVSEKVNRSLNFLLFFSI